MAMFDLFIGVAQLNVNTLWNCSRLGKFWWQKQRIQSTYFFLIAAREYNSVVWSNGEEYQIKKIDIHIEWLDEKYVLYSKYKTKKQMAREKNYRTERNDDVAFEFRRKPIAHFFCGRMGWLHLFHLSSYSTTTTLDICI